MNILIDGQTLESPELNRGIGIYFKNTLNSMVKQSYEHCWFITVSKKSAITTLDPWVSTRVTPIVDDIFAPSFDYERTDSYTKKLKKIIRNLKIDIAWIPNPLMINVLFPNSELGCKTFATLYDLIPVIMPVKEWSPDILKEYNRRLKFMGDCPIELLCISEATRNDFEKYVCQKEGLHVTFLAADSRLFYRPRTKSGINDEPRVVFTGGFDYRKNMNGAVEALAMATKLYPEYKLVQNTKLNIVCNAPKKLQDRFYLQIDKLGLKGRVVLTGFISNEELSDLYASADLFFFPSLYEGFGLPILEAMLGGAFILSADNSSLPEVCNGHAIFCNAENVEDMALKLKIALEESGKETLEDKIERQNYALAFSWEATALKTLKLFEDSETHTLSDKRIKLAMVTPWPNQKTGIANYVYKLIPYLTKHIDVDVFVDNSVDKNSELLGNPYGALYPISELDNKKDDYDEILYEIGNNSEFHMGTYEMIRKYKGISEIHDYILHPFFYHSYYLNRKYEIYKEALINGYGKDGLNYYNRVKSGLQGPDDIKYPMSHSVSSISKQTIFHNHWSRIQSERNDLVTIPHPSFDKLINEETDKQQLKQKYKIYNNEDIVIGCFGFINKNKRPEKILEAIEILLRLNYHIKLIFFGQVNFDGIEDIIKKKNLQEAVYITGYLNTNEYNVGLEICDIVINLRYPSMGESSGTLCEAFKYGKPVLVTEVNQYLEFPDEVCWKVPVGEHEVPVMVEMLRHLIDNAEIRLTLGQNAKAYADYVLSPDRIARQYYNVIKSITQEY